jgi:hypothetical protein
MENLPKGDRSRQRASCLLRVRCRPPGERLCFLRCELLAPALLAALVVTETFGEDQHLVLDERAVGITVAAMALLLRAPVLLAVGLAVATTALARAFG